MRNRITTAILIAAALLGAAEGHARGEGAQQGGPAPRTPAAPDGLIAVPFTLEKEQIVLEVSIGASGPFHFLLDTGTDPSVINLATAQALGIPLGEPSEAGGGAGTGPLEVRRCSIPALVLGPVATRALEASSIALPGLSGPLGRRLDGVLGYGFLKDRIFTIDYAARTLTFHPPLSVDRAALFRRGRNRAVVPFEFIGEDRTPFARLL